MHSILSNQLLLFFLIPAIGIAFSKISIRGISLGVSAVIFVSLFFGHMGVVTPPFIMKMGIAFFLFSVGIQAGPSFFSTIKSSGFFLLFVAFLLISSAVLTTIGCIYLLGVEPEMALGLLNGALTSTPGLAAAIESSSSPSVIVGYSLAYPFGVLGVVFFVKFIPKLSKIDLEKADKDYQKSITKNSPSLFSKSFLVENKNMSSVKLSELNLEDALHVNISRVTHEEETVVPNYKTQIELGDVIRVVGTIKSLEKMKIFVGKEIQENKDLKPNFDVKQFVLVNSKFVNKTLRELNLIDNFNARVTRVQRNSIEIRPTSKTRLRYGDKLMIAYDTKCLPALSIIFGSKPNRLSDDLFTLFCGIVLGVLLSLPTLTPVSGLNISLGLSGGVILSAILLSAIGKMGPIVWFVSSSTNKVVREFGLIFFFVGVGTKAGAGLSAVNMDTSLVYILSGALITSVPLVVVFWGLRKIMKTNILKILGILTGGMTSTPGLASIASATKSNAPTLFYASIYPFALVILLIYVKILSLLFT